ncbi:MAG: cobyric acid synthase [Planctomycetaceae bacterium]|nr:cobyric acid synthase [Planctomycetaceae bacterium]
MAKALMIQGTASGAGKSLTVAGLCRLFRRDGYSVAPFKSQNMALNSFITLDGLEMGRAQVVQAEAAGIEPDVRMNPILLKPTGDAVSQVIVNGEVVANLPAAEYYRRKLEFLPAIKAAYSDLAASHDIVVIEGAGSPAEINLAENDIVNMGMAAIADAPVLLVGDIDRGGVFASLYGTIALLSKEDQARIRGTIINKFRGDPAILQPGLDMLRELTGVPVLGVVPYLRLDIDDEDSLSDRLGCNGGGYKPVDCAVIRLPRLSNYTDFAALERYPAIGVRYVDHVRRLGQPDICILPGSKNTMADLQWLRQNGLETAIKRLAAAGRFVVGVCGGYQMLGRELADPDGVESGGTMRGMELLPVTTTFSSGKVRTRVQGRVTSLSGPLAFLAGAEFEGYEIHMGKTIRQNAAGSFATLSGPAGQTDDGAVFGTVFGSYVHGLFDSGDLAERLAAHILAEKGMEANSVAAIDHAAHRQGEYDKLADALRDNLDMNAIYQILGNH